MKNSYLGRQYTETQIKNILDKEHWEYQVFDKDDEMAHIIAGLLKDGKVIGRFVGKEEFGPRALGNRSILANPMISDMQNRLNMKIKFREGFRPFAPVVKFDKANEWFEIEKESKYMLFTYDVNKSKRNNKVCENEDGFKRLKIHRSRIQAATHVDYSSRVQTIKEVDNAKLYQLLSAFENLTGCPVLINTSFNVRGEPIVGSPSDALFCFMATEMDALQIESFLLIKEKQSKDKNREYSKSIHLND